MHPEQEPTFLPLTVSVTWPAAASTSAENHPAESGSTESLGMARIRERVRDVDVAAAGCWAALLGDCGSPDRAALPSRLHRLIEATSDHVGQYWWFGDGSGLRRKLVEAQARIADAVREGDGAEFAEAFIGYDQAVATAVVSVRNRLEKPTS